MSDPQKLPITVIIPTRNEEKNLPECLRSVGWADQVFVVDSRSTDRTAQIAREHGAEVVVFDYDGGWPKKKNWAIRNLPIRNPWFLILDADERVDDALRDEMEVAILRHDIDGYYLRWRFIFLGRWMRHSWSHGWMLRLVRTGRGEYEDLGMRGEGGWDNEVHENIVVEGKTGRLSGWLTHDSNESLSYWIRKQNEFSDWNAERRLRQIAEGMPAISEVLSGDPLRHRKFLKALFLRMPLKPVLMFLYLYVARLGFLDGQSGLYFCALRAAHELNVSAKLFELRLSRLSVASSINGSSRSDGG
jgi:glycosyltransferase involved in cell wall biosynthesis